VLARVVARPGSAASHRAERRRLAPALVSVARLDGGALPAGRRHDAVPRPP
jgi:hypothetical protein